MAYRWIKVEDDPSYNQIIAKAEKLHIFKKNIDAVDKKKLMRKALQLACQAKLSLFADLIFCFVLLLNCSI